MIDNLPNIEEKCGKHFAYRDFLECSETWNRTKVNNIPQVIETYDSIKQIADEILDPVQERFGRVILTYAFSSPALIKEIKKKPYPNIAPSIDQHSGSELNTKGNLICKRRGIAVDFYIEETSSLEVACWIAENTKFDRLYFYGPDRPIHVSVGPENNKAIVYIKGTLGSRHQPYKYTLEKLKALNF